ncbi:MAG: GDP-mannose 4,6-dehydratase, partial [Bacteroidota bacterium]
MKILVTGGAGFIGSNLTDSLLLQGHEVRIIDNLSTGLLDNIQHMMENANLRFSKGDVTDRELMEESIEWADHIYHLAAPVGVKYIMENPVKTVLDNIRGADLMLELVNKYKKRVLIAS